MPVDKIQITNSLIGHIMHELRFVIASDVNPDVKVKLQRMYLSLSDISDLMVDPDVVNADAGNHVTE